MATRTLSRALRHTNKVSKPFYLNIEPRQTFITIPGTEATVLQETRVLPYRSSNLYTLIADVDSYSSFLPYCQESRVTKWSAADKNGRKWPAEADLKVGWGGYEETFTSRLFCSPDSIVEALGGKAETTIPKSKLQHHSSTFNTPAEPNNIFKSLSTRWTIKPIHLQASSGRPQSEPVNNIDSELTEVHLTIEFQFQSPLYAALSKAIAPKVAAVMIDAFEERARKLLDGPRAPV